MNKIIISLLLLSGLISAPARAEAPALQDNPPERYEVVKGDTLWGIAGRFLKQPWRWPEIWQLNREQIRNPHWIYPGDIIVLDRSGAVPQLRLVQTVRFQGETVRLNPAIRIEESRGRAVPSIPPSAIEPFLTRPLVMEDHGLEQAPMIVGAPDERLILGKGDRIYAAGISASAPLDWQIIRQGKELLDPESGAPLGRELEYIGTARVVAHTDPATLEITAMASEARLGDRLIPAAEKQVLAYVPHAPDKPVEGQIISAYGGTATASAYGIVALNRGAEHGLEAGHVLAVYRQGRTTRPLALGAPQKTFPYLARGCLESGQKIRFDEFYDPAQLRPCPPDGSGASPAGLTYADVGCLKPGARVSFDQFFDPREVYRSHCRPEKLEAVTLPNERTGLLFVFRVFGKISYALVVQANRPVHLLDQVKNP